MITKNDFFSEPGHNCTYSNCMIIGKTVDEVIAALNAVCPDVCVGWGDVNEDNFQNRTVSFEIEEDPAIIYPLCRELQAIGYADCDWEYSCFWSSKNGYQNNSFTAAWNEGMPCPSADDESLYDLFITVTDGETGAKFPTGTHDACSSDAYWWQNFVLNHLALKKGRKWNDAWQKAKKYTF